MMIARTFGTLILATLGVPAYAGSDDKPAGRAKDLEGEWRVVEIERDGETLKGPEVTGLRMTFKGDGIAIGGGEDASRRRKKTFTRDTSKSPKEIDITSLDGREKGQNAACIYELKEGRLRLCMPYDPAKDARERPAEFKTRIGDGLMLFRLERVEPK